MRITSNLRVAAALARGAARHAGWWLSHHLGGAARDVQPPRENRAPHAGRSTEH